MGLYSGGLLSEGYLRLSFGGAYFREGFLGGGGVRGGGLLSEFYGMTFSFQSVTKNS